MLYGSKNITWILKRSSDNLYYSYSICVRAYSWILINFLAMVESLILTHLCKMFTFTLRILAGIRWLDQPTNTSKTLQNIH